jgi:hypothetical protein
MTATRNPVPDIRSLLENGFNEETANFLYAQGKEVVIFALMQLAAIASQSLAINDHPSTPSATVPPYQKPPGKKVKKKPGAKRGHKGSRRAPPVVNGSLSKRIACTMCTTKPSPSVQWASMIAWGVSRPTTKTNSKRS